MRRLLDEWPDWSGETCMIVASGPSAVEQPIDLARGLVRCIAINKSWQLAPWADMLYACDWAWWENTKGCSDFGGLRVSMDERACREWDIANVFCNKITDTLITEPRGSVGWGGNSGFQALNLAAQFGCTRILLVGYDMTIEGGLHWHGAHPTGMSNPRGGSVVRWRRAIDGADKVLRGMGIDVINCSPVSALTRYPKMSLEEALAGCGGNAQCAA